MKILLRIVWLSILSVGAHADEKMYNQVLEQYEAKNSSEIQYDWSGKIDGEQHLVIVSGRIDPILTVFKKGPTQYEGVAQTVLLPRDFAIEVRKNSIFVEGSSCHHGCNYERYQFKYVRQQLRLAGVEFQGETNSCYYDDRSLHGPVSSNCAEHELMYGNSYNLLTSTTICWLTDVDHETNTKQTPHETPRRYQPRGVLHKMAIQRIDLPLLDGISLDGTDMVSKSLPKSCYFDYNKKLKQE